jgi:hypothetical protein
VKPKRRYYKEYDYVYYTVKYSTILHREDGPAIIYKDGGTSWYRYGMLHRIGGPARIFSNNGEEWWQNGNLHRLDGPAVIYLDGSVSWYLNGIYYSSKEEWFEKLKEEQKAKALFSEYFIK